MKCKRCRAQVPDDAVFCPHCHQDLTSLSQLLKISGEEEPAQREVQRHLSPQPDGLLSPEGKEPPEIDAGPKIILDSRGMNYGVDYGAGFSLTAGHSTEEPFLEIPKPSTWERALRGGFWLRLLAFTVDQFFLLLLFIFFVVAGLLAVGLAPPAGSRDFSFLSLIHAIFPALVPLAILLGLAYFSFFHAAWGQTIGKMIFGLRVVKTNGQSLTFSRALARSIAYILSALPIFLGFFWVGFTRSKRSLHDRIVGTMVVREQ
ncbi:MAG: RDD family protein [Thermodesulfobacteriota bacterium]|nr:RDD family protein [Thermodesulfobacteriota bacterium]